MVVGAVKSPQISPVVRCGISILQQSRKRGHLRSGDCRMLSPRHILLVLAMLLIIGGAWGQSRPPPMTIRQQSQTQSQQQKTESDQRGTEQLPLVVQPLPTKKTAEERQRETNEAKDKINSDWWTWFLSVLTVIALFGQLAVFVAQAYVLKGTLEATKTAAIGSKTAAEHLPLIERAFIHGGVHPKGRTLVNNERDIRVCFSMANYGKTPAFIKSVKVGSALLAGLSDAPDYSKDVPVSDWFFPMMTMDEVRLLDDVEVTVPGDGKHVVFQRVFYDDVFWEAS
jgi:hypothetical protein